MDSWGSPAGKAFRKCSIRPVTVGGTSILIHSELVDITAEIIQLAVDQGIHLPEKLGGWIPYVDGRNPQETGKAFICPKGLPPESHEVWDFWTSGPLLIFRGSIDHARELSVLAESQRVVRLVPKVAKPVDVWQTFPPGERSLNVGDKGDDVQFFQMVYDFPDQDGVMDDSLSELVAYIQRRNGLMQTGVIDDDVWRVVLPTTLNYRMGYGTSGNMVRVLQAILVAYDWSSELTINGRFDQATMQTVRSLQATYGLRETGEMAMPEWSILLGKAPRSV